MKRTACVGVRNRLAVFGLGLAALAATLLSGCGNLGDPVVEAPIQPPRIAYDTSMTLFTGSLDARAVRSDGGPVTAYSISPALPAGLELHPIDGGISGAPESASAPARYTVTATGPGGTGTASFTLTVHDIVLDSGAAKPGIRYVTPVYDTVGKAAVHAVLSTGGPVSAYTVHPALPPGLALEASTGRISGTPTAARPETDYSIVASGPGGRDTAVLRLTVATAFARPSIAYPTPVYDTLGVPVRHAPVSTGGPVASYALLSGEYSIAVPRSSQVQASPVLPDGLTFDPATGVISGTPTAALLPKSALTPAPWNVHMNAEYSIEATGPGGKDTASIRILLVSFGGIYPEPFPPDPSQSQIAVSMKIDSLGMPLSRLIVRLQANTSFDLPILDTIRAGTQGFAALAPAGQTVYKTYTVKPLRNWTVMVFTDTGGEIVRSGQATASNLLVGEVRALSVNVTDKGVVSQPMPPNPLP